jgi:hypothetical protein
MKARKILENLRHHGFAPWLQNGKLYMPENSPQWAIEQAREHRAALQTLLKYKVGVQGAHELEHAIDENGEHDRLPEYEKLLSSFRETERVLRFYGCSPKDFAQLFEGKPRYG